MSIIVDIKSQLADAFNAEHGTTWKFEELAIQGLAKVDSTYPPAFRVRNTIITLVKDGKLTNVGYDRIDVAPHVAIPEGIKFALPRTADGNIRQLASRISKRVGVAFEANDFEDTKYNIASLPGTLRFTIGAQSLRFIPGTFFDVEIPSAYLVKNGVCELAPFTLDGTPELFQFGHAVGSQSSGTRANAAINTAKFDYTPVGHIIRQWLPYAGYADDDRLIRGYTGVAGMLVAALTSIDGIPWTVNTAAGGAFNLGYAWCVYNGPAKGARAWLARGYDLEPQQFLAAVDLNIDDYDNVMLLRLNYARATNLQASFAAFHYNDVIEVPNADN